MDLPDDPRWQPIDAGRDDTLPALTGLRIEIEGALAARPSSGGRRSTVVGHDGDAGEGRLIVAGRVYSQPAAPAGKPDATTEPETTLTDG